VGAADFLKEHECCEKALKNVKPSQENTIVFLGGCRSGPAHLCRGAIRNDLSIWWRLVRCCRLSALGIAARGDAFATVAATSTFHMTSRGWRQLWADTS
jgi:hypothetical protein